MSSISSYRSSSLPTYLLSVNMAKRGSTSFLAAKVAKSGLITAKALERVLELEKVVSRLRHC